jgi:hypothetical protein
MRNPFLTTRKRPEQLTCDDCGLDFDTPADSAHDPGRDSGGSPWGKP